MSRRRRIGQRLVAGDYKYDSSDLSRFINTFMTAGKKSCAEKIVYYALKVAAARLSVEDELSVFLTAIANVRPAVEVRSRRVGGATYQVPVEVNLVRSRSLAFRWIRAAAAAARRKSNKTYAECLAHELFEAYNKRGGACKVREEKYRMAEANKAFSHFRFN